MRFRTRVLLAACGVLLGVRPPASAQWVQTSGPEGCHITSLAAAGNTILAAVEGYGLFMSADNGVGWTAVRTGFPPDQDFTRLASSKGTFFAGSEHGLVLFSKDGGATWRQVDPGFPGATAGRKVDCLAPVGTDLFISTAWGDYVRPDYAGGAAAVPLGSSKGGMINSFAVVGSDVIAGQLRWPLLLFRKTGGAWIRSELPRPKVGELICLESIGTDLIAGTDEGVFLSTDKGASWTNISSGLPKPPYVTCLGVSGSDIVAGLSELLVPEDPVGIRLTRGAGGAWAVAELGLKNVDIECFTSGGTHLFAGTTTGIFRSPDGGVTWAPVNAGLPVASSVPDIMARGQDLFAVTSQGVPSIGGAWLSPDDGRTWKMIGPRLRRNSKVACLAGSGPNVLAGISSRSWEEDEKIEGVFLSPDNGRTWITASSGLPPNAIVDHLAVIGQTVYAGTHIGIYKSGDNGASWEPFSEGLPGMPSVSCLVAVGQDLFAGIPQASYDLPTGSVAPAGVSLSAWGQYLFAAGPPPTGRLFLLAKGASKWKDTRIRLSSPVNSLAKIGPALFLGTARGLYLCENYVESPRAFKVKMSEDISVSSLAASGTDLFVGTRGGVIMVTKSENWWTTADTGMPEEVGITRLLLRGQDLFAGTEERGVWRLPVSALKKSDH